MRRISNLQPQFLDSAAKRGRRQAQDFRCAVRAGDATTCVLQNPLDVGAFIFRQRGQLRRLVNGYDARSLGLL